jgi:alkylation response protein AidB-like acyl-CoA dehydrogenase
MGKLSARGAVVLERARTLGPLIAAAAGQIEASRDLPEPLFSALVEADLFRLLQPLELGGAEIEPMDLVQVLEQIAMHDASTAWCLGQGNVCGTVTAYLAPEVSREIFPDARGIVAWGPGPGEARAVPGGYRLNGAFNFASGSRHATWLGANVPVLEADGTRRTAPDGSPTGYTLLFPKERAQVLDTWQVLGLRGTGSDSYNVADLFVPEAYAIPRNTQVKPRIDARLYRFTPSTLYSSGFAGIALGIARATLDGFVREIRDTVPRGASKRRGDNNVVQAEVGRAEARLRSARMFLLGSLEQIWHEVGRSGALTREQNVTIRLATTWAIQQARETVAALYLAAGAVAIFAANPFERRFRDIHTLTQQIQGHAAHFETVGQILLGMEPDRPLFTF